MTLFHSVTLDICMFNRIECVLSSSLKILSFSMVIHPLPRANLKKLNVALISRVSEPKEHYMVMVITLKHIRVHKIIQGLVNVFIIISLVPELKIKLEISLCLYLAVF